MPSPDATDLRRHQQLKALYQLSKIIGATSHTGQALVESFNALSELLSWSQLLLGVRSADTGNTEIVASLGTGGLTETPVSTTDSVRALESVIRSGYPEVKSDKNWRSICVPMRVRSRTTGALLAEQTTVAPSLSFEEEVNFLRIVGSLLGQALELQTRLGQKTPGSPMLSKGQKAATQPMVGNSLVLRKVLEAVDRVGPGEATALILGESGTGKELVAHALHAVSPRHSYPFVKVVCASLPENLLEDSLFGHERGAFTGAEAQRIGYLEEADGGTVFLDEIGDIPLSTQVKLLRFLQERTFERLGGSRPLQVDVRVIAATHRNLEEMVRRGEFREDLFYRLNVVPIYIPPLRSRAEDIPLLVDYFVKARAETYHREIVFSNDALNKLTLHPWPGNIRELENFIERLMVLAPDALITAKDIVLPKYWSPEKQAKNETKAGLVEPPRAIQTLEDAERDQVVRALEEASGLQKIAAKNLGITPRQLAYRIQKYGIRQAHVTYK